MTRKAIDLFSGCGGLTQGLRDAGYKVLAGAEIREEARATYKLNHKGIEIYEDIRSLTAATILEDTGLAVGELDLLAACPPCQGFSTIRTRNKDIVEDLRNELIFEVARLTEQLLPKCVLIENVPRLLADARLIEFKGRLAQHGYTFSEGVLDAKNFGVPQRRKRMILIGCRLSKIELPSVNQTVVPILRILGDLPTPDGKHKRPLHRIYQQLSPEILHRVSLIKRNRNELPKELTLKCHLRCADGFRDVYGRMKWDEVAPTITRFSHNPSKGRFLHPEQNRGLTMHEAKLLQGFPARYKFSPSLGIGKIASMIGEAFPPPMAKAQAYHIYKRLDQIEDTTGGN